MKILHYTYDDPHNPRCGGGGIYREIGLHKQLSSRHEIRFYTGTYKNARTYTEDNIRFSHLGIGNNYLLSRITFAFFATIHSIFAPADLYVIGYSVFSPVMTFLFKPKKTILQFYHFTALEPFRKYGIFGTLSWLAEQIALRYNRNFITMADSVAEIIKNKYHKSNVRPTYTGFDEKLLCETPEDKNFILSFGRLDVHMKGLDILIPAFEKISPQFPLHTLIIAGRGTEKDISWIKNRIKESPCADRIDLINGVPYEKKLELFRTATIVAIPSRFEGWCIVAIEAAASSKATVGTKILGLGDAIVDGKTGILVPSEDVNALAEKMKLLLNNATLRNELGKNGYEWAQRFTWDKMAKLQEEFYENTVKGLQ